MAGAWAGGLCCFHTVSGQDVKNRIVFWGKKVLLAVKVCSICSLLGFTSTKIRNKKEQVFLDECSQFLIITSISPVLQKDLFSDKGKNALFSYLKSEAYFTQNPISLCNLLPCQLLSARLRCLLSGNIAKAKRRKRSLPDYAALLALLKSECWLIWCFQNL